MSKYYKYYQPNEKRFERQLWRLCYQSFDESY